MRSSPSGLVGGDEADFVDFADLAGGMGDEFDADLLLALKHGGGNLVFFGDAQASGLGIGKLRGLLHHDPPILPIEARRHIEIHPQVVATMHVGELPVLAVILHARAYATPHGLVGRRIIAVVSRTCRPLEMADTADASPTEEPRYFKKASEPHGPEASKHIEVGLDLIFLVLLGVFLEQALLHIAGHELIAREFHRERRTAASD